MFDSKKEINIQASDLLCGFISNTFKSISNGINLDDETFHILGKVICMNEEFMKSNARVFDWCASYQFEEKFFYVLNPEAEIDSNYYHAVIDNDFIKAVR